VQLHQAPDDQSVDDLRHHVRQRLVQEEELVVDPAFFIALAQHVPRVTGVRIEPKRGPAHNELTKFRYEATLIVDGDPDAADGTWLDWSSDSLSLDALRRRLDEGPGVTIGVRGVPNARTTQDLAAADFLLNTTRNGTVRELREMLGRETNGAGFDPSDLLALGEAAGRAPAVGWSNRSEGGAFDVLYTPGDDPDRTAPFATPRLEPRPWSHYANHPLQAKMTRQLAPRLRESLERTLPGYMIPSAFVMLESLPLTANGKVDRRALPEPEWYLSQRRGTFIAPRTPTESKLAEVWSELLGVEDVGVEDDFFDLGGHSLLATQVVSRAREAFGVELEVRQLFDTPTIATLAEALDALAWAAESRDGARDDDDDEREGGVL
jgi:acyl carrier protein